MCIMYNGNIGGTCNVWALQAPVVPHKVVPLVGKRWTPLVTTSFVAKKVDLYKDIQRLFATCGICVQQLDALLNRKWPLGAAHDGRTYFCPIGKVAVRWRLT